MVKRTTKKATGKALINWEQQLSRDADIAAAVEAKAAVGQLVSLRGGQLSMGGQAVPNNQVAAIVLAEAFENLYYAGAFDIDNPTGPDCYALQVPDQATVDQALEMVPHPDVVARDQAEHETCTGCPQNAFGSADTGRGKACRNTRRLMLMSAGTLHPKTDVFEIFTEASQLQLAPIYMMNLPVTSVKGWASYVQNLRAAFHRPPYAVATLIRVLPDPKTQFRVTFEPLEQIDLKLMDTLAKRREEALVLAAQPRQLDFEDAAPPVKAAPRKKAKVKRKTARGRY